MKKTAVVLLNLGGPHSLDDVEPFLRSIFSDPSIITLHNPWRFLIAFFISKLRSSKAKDMYRLLGGKSPLYENTLLQAQALQQALGENFKVFIAMRHAFPKTEDTLKQVISYDPDDVILLPLYPQFSTTTTQSSFKEWKTKADKLNFHKKTRFICCYPEHPALIEAISELTLPMYQEAQNYGKPLLLFVAHGLPQKIVAKGDPYQRHVEKTYHKICQKLKLPQEETYLCYQSRVGPLKWIQPYIEDEIVKGAMLKRPLLVVPISFVSEHSETLVELDIIYKNLAFQAGAPYYGRVQTVSTNKNFINGLVDLIEDVSKTLKSNNVCLGEFCV